MSDYIPREDANALIWMQAFSSVISNSPSTYQLSVGDAAAIADAVQEFADALLIANTNSTRTPDTVNVKDTKRNAAETLCRQYAIDIKYDDGIDDSAKIAAGVRPVNTSREPVFCPQTVPMVNIVAATPGSQTLRFADSLEPEKRAKPFGAIGLELWLYKGAEATTDESLASYIGMYTKNPIAVEFGAADDGLMATFFAKWVGTRGDTSPFSLPVSMRIAA